MNENVEKNCRELIAMLSCHDAEPEEVEEMMPVLKLALSDPKAYIKEYPEDQWLGEGFDLNTFNPQLAENLFAWSLSAVMVDFVVVGDKGDELCDAVMEVLYEMDIEIQEPNFELANWFEYAEFIEKELVKNKAGKRLVALDINFSDDISVFVVESADYDKIMELVRYFNLKVVDSSQIPAYNKN